jgi:hypothetical protein
MYDKGMIQKIKQGSKLEKDHFKGYCSQDIPQELATAALQ